MVLQLFLRLCILCCREPFRLCSVLHHRQDLVQWRRLFLVRECRWCVWGKERLVECQMNVPVCWKLQSVCWCSLLCDDEKWTCAFVGEFFSLVVGDLGWSCQAIPCLLLGIQLQVVSFCRTGLSSGRQLFQSSFGFLMNFLYFGNEGGGHGLWKGACGLAPGGC